MTLQKPLSMSVTHCNVVGECNYDNTSLLTLYVVYMRRKKGIGTTGNKCFVHDSPIFNPMAKRYIEALIFLGLTISANIKYIFTATLWLGTENLFKILGRNFDTTVSTQRIEETIFGAMDRLLEN